VKGGVTWTICTLLLPRVPSPGLTPGAPPPSLSFPPSRVALINLLRKLISNKLKQENGGTNSNFKKEKKVYIKLVDK